MPLIRAPWHSQLFVVVVVVAALTDAALIDVLVAGAAPVSRLAVAVVHAVDGVGVTLRAPPAGVAHAGVGYVAQQA